MRYARQETGKGLFRLFPLVLARPLLYSLIPLINGKFCRYMVIAGSGYEYF